ncbi:MAG: hypothetical protein ACO1QB_02515 [Verrucomicrobiales bacterium]
MDLDDNFRKDAIHYWERKRIAHNFLLVLPALLGYGLYTGISAGVGDERRLSGLEVIFIFIISALAANICYSFCYTLEFIFGVKANNERWSRFWRPLLFVLGTLFAMALSLEGGRTIGMMEYR